MIPLNLIWFLQLVALAERFLHGCYWDPTPERRVPRAGAKDYTASWQFYFHNETTYTEKTVSLLKGPRNVNLSPQRISRQDTKLGNTTTSKVNSHTTVNITAMKEIRFSINGTAIHIMEMYCSLVNFRKETDCTQPMAHRFLQYIPCNMHTIHILMWWDSS